MARLRGSDLAPDVLNSLAVELPNTASPAPYCFLKFSTHESAAEALELLEGKLWGVRPIVVRWASTHQIRHGARQLAEQLRALQEENSTLRLELEELKLRLEEFTKAAAASSADASLTRP